jgi:hypothetical protein
MPGECLPAARGARMKTAAGVGLEVDTCAAVAARCDSEGARRASPSADPVPPTPQGGGIYTGPESSRDTTPSSKDSSFSPMSEASYFSSGAAQCASERRGACSSVAESALAGGSSSSSSSSPSASSCAHRDSLSAFSALCLSEVASSAAGSSRLALGSASSSPVASEPSGARGAGSGAGGVLPALPTPPLPPTSKSAGSSDSKSNTSGSRSTCNTSVSLRDDSSSSGRSSPSAMGEEDRVVASPSLAAHYHSYSADDLALHVSIAQGGLQRIRREAQTAQVSLKDIVDMFGSSIANMAAEGDDEVRRRGWGCHQPIRAFDGSVVPKISVSDYLWRIVRALNAHSDPALFASDGSDLSRITAAVSFDHLDNQADGASSAVPATGPAAESVAAADDAATVAPGDDLLVPAAQRASASTSTSTSTSQPLEGENSAMGRGLRCLLLAFVYIDRVCTRCSQAFRITRLSVHRVILSAIYLATKFTDDTLPKAHWTFAKLGGVSCRELMMLEETFCRLIDFRFYLTESEYQVHAMEMLRNAVRSVRHLKEARQRLAQAQQRQQQPAALNLSELLA